jgi:beta-1,4-N-acetylglucosaminyltransferase
MKATPEKQTVFVTVGTTKFDALVAAVDDPSFADALIAAGYTHLVIQFGAGAYRPHRLFPAAASSARLQNGLQVECFDFAPSLQERLAGAALVVSHAGAGSIFESLALGKPVIAVPNPALMDDHQRELAEKLEGAGYLVASLPETGALGAAVGRVQGRVLRPYPSGGPEGIAGAIDELRGRWF